jgi:hypothetical protein
MGQLFADSGDGTATLRQRRVSLFSGLLTLVCLGAAILASQASATYLHSERPAHAFGPDGTSNFSDQNSFYDNNITDMAIDAQRRRLYVLQYQNPENGGQGTFYPGAQRGIYGYDISDASHPKPLGGRFPLAITEGQGAVNLAVDESDGSIYMVEKAEECFCETGGTLLSWNVEGKLRAGYPVHIERWGPMEFDSEGYLWVWHGYGAPNENLFKYLPDGTLVEEFNPNVESIGGGQDLAFDRQTGDMYLQYSEGIVKFTKDSNFTYHEPPVPTATNEQVGFEVDSAHDVTYSVAPYYSGGGIAAINAQGGLVEQIFGLGGLEEYSEACGGPCPPDVPEAQYVAMSFDPVTGNLWVANDGYANGRLEQQEQVKGGRIEVFTGIGASDAHTNAPAEIGKTDAVLSGEVGPGEGPPVDGCRFEYVADNSYKHVRVVSLGGATGGRFRFNESQKWLPYNATAFEVEHAWPEESYIPAHSVTGPAGGPWRIEFGEFEYSYQTVDRFVSIHANELKPYSPGARIHIGWDASTAACEPPASTGSPISSATGVEAAISGLAPETKYHYRVVADSAAGEVMGGVEEFTTTASKVSTGPATEVDRKSATLNERSTRKASRPPTTSNTV